MAREIRNFAAVIVTGSTSSAPQTVNLDMPARYVRSVRVRVPPGPKGALGFALASAGVNVIPWGSGQWIVADDEVFDWPLEGYVESGSWQVRAYNLGGYPHTLYVTFQLDPLTAGSSPVISSPLVVSP
jgi:hypothetical protein